jgi:ectoine hydroxylase-related dioxygenase (phytanoyl-CoA dioxygenase family)
MQIDRKHEFMKKGFSGPIPLISAREADRLRESLGPLLESRGYPERSYSAVTPVAGDGKAIETIYDAHQDDPDLHRLATHPTLVSLAREILGSEVAIWRSTFWIKPPGGRRLEWHQDTYKEEGFGSFPNLNAWIALDKTEESNCVWLVNGTHRNIIDLDVFRNATYVESLRESDDLPPPPPGLGETITKMALDPGQCFIFDGRTLHGSPPNRRDTRRAGIVIRFIPLGTELPGLRTTLLEL